MAFVTRHFVARFTNMLRAHAIAASRHSRLAGLIHLVALTVACGTSSPEPMGPIPETDAAREFAAATCTRARERACDVPETCEAEVEQQFAAAQKRAMEQGRAYDVECLQAHIDRLVANPYFFESYGCSVYPGTIGPGEPCQQEGPFQVFSGCEPDLICSNDAGVCLPRDCPGTKGVPIGTACLGADGCLMAHCGYFPDMPAFCDLTAAEPVCTPEAQPGEACGTDLGCVDRGACHDGICGLRLAGGEACERGTECMSLVCVDGACSDADHPTGCMGS